MLVSFIRDFIIISSLKIFSAAAGRSRAVRIDTPYLLFKSIPHNFKFVNTFIKIVPFLSIFYTKTFAVWLIFAIFFAIFAKNAQKTLALYQKPIYNKEEKNKLRSQENVQ